MPDPDEPLPHPLWRRVKSYIFSPYTYAIALGLAGGALFAWAGAPLAWLLGAMLFTTTAAFGGVNVRVHDRLRTVMIIVLGVLLGSTFRPQLIHEIPGWGLAALLTLIALVVMTAIAFGFLRLVGRHDPITAYFSSTPGGVNSMVIIGEDAGANVRTISLTHAIRILIVVCVVPLYFRYVQGVDVPAQTALSVGGTKYGWLEISILLGCGVIGFPLAKMLKLPTPSLLGPMMLSAAAHMSGISHVSPPPALVAIAQVVIGAGIGARFAGVTFDELWKTALSAVGSALTMIGIVAVLAPFMADLAGVSPAAMFLALVPGGLTEMALIALSLNVDTAFVSAMHILRIVFVIGVAPLVFALWARFGEKPED
jgi:membrane AbrB-like protein